MMPQLYIPVREAHETCSHEIAVQKTCLEHASVHHILLRGICSGGSLSCACLLTKHRCAVTGKTVS